MKKLTLWLLAVCLTVSLGGCGKKKEGQAPTESGSSQSQSAVDPEAQAVLDAAEAFFSASRSLDIAKINTYAAQMGMDNIPELEGDAKEAAGLLVQKLDATLGDPQISGDSATLAVSITNTDFSGIVAGLAPDLMGIMLQDPKPTEAELTQTLSKSLVRLMGEADGKTVTKETTLTLARSGGVWEARPDKETLKTMCGGMLDSAESLLAQFGASLPEGLEE